ncbi:molybdenum cofactor biosynthesis protein A [Corchorus capsularis]|uniref:Molybdenum cofactor biosynthesis protein A n=1 Tax=Corchorus capsularis TaxID=210143 RepID=A0A1R3JGC1_COCAP|nr:molybdenum cofactor biosynthesis protein A [Corchorus capsularis]
MARGEEGGWWREEEGGGYGGAIEIVRTHINVCGNQLSVLFKHAKYDVSGRIRNACCDFCQTPTHFLFLS